MMTSEEEERERERERERVIIMPANHSDPKSSLVDS